MEIFTSTENIVIINLKSYYTSIFDLIMVHTKTLFHFFVTRAENFRIVDIAINA